MRDGESENLLIAGATGLIGALVLEKLLAGNRTGRVFAPVRRAPPTRNARLVVLPEDLADPGADARLLQRIRDLGGATSPDPSALLLSFVCCLGTTLKDAGSQSAFRAVDQALVVRMARLSRTLGARHAILVSSVGANAKSGNFYLRVKGEVEEQVNALGFERVDILRPGLLLGERRGPRAGESIAQSLAFLYNPLLRGPLQRYRAIAAATVADAIVALLDERTAGDFVHENAAILDLAV